MDLLKKLLKEMVERRASDLFLTSKIVPALRINGTLYLCGKTPLTPGKTEAIARLVVTDERYELFLEKQEMNVVLEVPTLGRFRFNLFRQRRDIALVVRAIPEKIPPFESLGLSEVLKNIVMLKHGLVLVVGPAGSGKSTTLAALMQHRAAHTTSHIITIEDPIEYLLEPRNSVVNQRELGIDTRSYHNALTNALRQSPDMLMVGEVRERQIMEGVIEFSDTGHLCLTTLHANTASQTFERIINMFPEEQRSTLCHSLTNNIQAIVAQRLVPTLDGKRTAVFELLIASARVRDLVHRRDFSNLPEAIEKDTVHGMQTFDQSLLELYRQKRISQETAFEFSESPSSLRLKMRLDTQ